MTLADRIDRLEKVVAKIDGQLDWAKIAASLTVGVPLAGFALLTTLTVFTLNKVEALSTKIDGITGKIAEEFRSQRTDQSAQVTAFSNAITAARQQAPQIVVLPAPQATAAPAK